MTDRCEPPPEWRDHCWHWLKIHDNSIVAFWWNGEGRRRTLGSLDPVEMACAGYTYLAPCRPDDATERLRLEAENARLRAALRVAALRHMPALTHAQISAEIERIAKGNA